MKNFFTAIAIFVSNVVCAQTMVSIFAGGGTSLGDSVTPTAAEFYSTQGLCADAAGNIYILDQSGCTVREVVASTGLMKTVVGNGSCGYAGDGGTATSAQISAYGLGCDPAGNLLIGDWINNRVREVNAATGIITTIAGTGSSGYSGDGGSATSATFSEPIGACFDQHHNIYISDYGNNCIRKIDAATGIVSLFAGRGSTGSYSYSGIPATSAQICSPDQITADGIGNIYVADQCGYVWKIDTAGMIYTFAGGGSSTASGIPAIEAGLGDNEGVAVDYFGNVYIANAADGVIQEVNPATDIITTIAGGGSASITAGGVPALSASFGNEQLMTFDNLGNLYLSTQGRYVYKISGIPASDPTYNADSFSVYATSTCTGPQLTVVTDTFEAGMYIKTYYGDGAIDSDIVAATRVAYFDHTYATSGTYTIKQVLYNAATVMDSVSFSYNYQFCNNITLTYYIDKNSDCTFDAGDFLSTQPMLTEIDSNGIVIDTISSINGFYYLANGNPGDIYTFKTISYPANMAFTCLGTGVISDTLQPVATVSSSLYVGMQCSTSTNDFTLSSYIPKHSQDEQWGWIYVNNTLCTDDATLTMAFSPNFTMESMVSTPYTISSNTITWSLAGDHDSLLSVFFKLNSSFMIPIGDTVQNHIKITPLDPDTLNNYLIVIDTIQAGCDPNNMWVSPNGCIPYTTGVTQLRYTISFMNTGNDTAYNIYALDTLSANVDISSMRMVMSSASMYISVLKDAAGRNILKFNFPNINLLDSAENAAKCSATVIFTVNTLPGLPDNTVINNEAGIYFDVNPVVITNSVQNVVGCSATGVTNVNSVTPIDIFPNPANGQIDLKTDPGVYSSLNITNDVGQQFITMPINAPLVYINIKILPPGLYYMTVMGNNSATVVKKFIKE